jgi:hypothetical protein
LFETAGSMASSAYELILRAMREKKQVTCTYQGQHREFCPIILGRTGLEEKVLVFQFAGSTSEGPVKPGGDWKCLKLKVRDARLRDGKWHAGDSHSAAQHCMNMVEYDVNPQSPYNPAFRL